MDTNQPEDNVESEGRFRLKRKIALLWFHIMETCIKFKYFFKKWHFPKKLAGAVSEGWTLICPILGP